MRLLKTIGKYLKNFISRMKGVGAVKNVWYSYTSLIPTFLFHSKKITRSLFTYFLKRKKNLICNLKRYTGTISNIFKKDSTSVLRRALYLTKGSHALIITPRKIIIQTFNPLPSPERLTFLRKRFSFLQKSVISFLRLVRHLFIKDILALAMWPFFILRSLGHFSLKALEKIIFSILILGILEVFFLSKTLVKTIFSFGGTLNKSLTAYTNGFVHYLKNFLRSILISFLSLVSLCEKTLIYTLTDFTKLNANLSHLITTSISRGTLVKKLAYRIAIRYGLLVINYLKGIYIATGRDIYAIFSATVKIISFCWSVIYSTLEDFYSILSSVRFIGPASHTLYKKSPHLFKESFSTTTHGALRHIFYPFVFVTEKIQSVLLDCSDIISEALFTHTKKFQHIPVLLSESYNSFISFSSSSSQHPSHEPQKKSHFSFFKKHYLTEVITLAIVFGTIGVFMSLYAAPTRATFPITYQGKLMDQNYVPKADTGYTLAFEIYDASTNGTCKWRTETGGTGVCDGTLRAISVTTNRGLFTALLGDGTTNNPALGENFNTGSAYYLQVRVCTDANAGSCETLTPRKQVGGSVYAYTAHRVGGTAGAMSGTPALVGLYNSLTTGTFTDSNTAASGTATNMVFNSIDQGTLASTNATVTTTNAYGFYLAGAPVKGTNNTVTNTIAFGIAAGAVGAQTNSYGLYVNAQTGATTNYAGVFSGGIVGIGTATPDSLLDISNTSISSTQPIVMISNETDTATLDPLLQFRTGATPTVNWTLGNDDSDGDKFLIGTSALNTNTMVTLDSRTTTDGITSFLITPPAPTISATSTTEFTTLTVTPPTVTLTGTENITSQMDSILFNAPTFTNASSATISNAATLTIAGAPVKANSITLTNTYGLKINAAAVSTATNAYGLYVSAPTGATNNYGGVIASGRFGIGDTSPDALLDFDFSSTSTTAASEYGGYFTSSDTGVVTSGTDITYSIYNALTRTGATGGTIDTYGQYISLTTDNAGSGTHRAWGLYSNLDGNADTNYGIYSVVAAAASQTSYGLYVDAGTGAGTEYAAIFTNGNVGIGNTAPTTLLTLGTAGTTAGALSMAGSSSGVVTLNVAAAAGTWTLTLPTNDGDSGQFLQTNGSGVTSWASPTAPLTVTSATNFETSARFSSASTNGTATFNTSGVTLATTGSATSYIRLLWAVNSAPAGTKLFSGSPLFSTRLAWKSGAASTGSAFVGIGTVTTAGSGHTWTNNHIGFIFIGNGTTTSVYASQADGSTENRSAALTTVDGGSNDVLDLILKVNSTTSVDYYWRKNAGSLSRATNLTSNLPTANEDSIQFSGSNDSTANNFTFDVGSASYER